LGRVATGGSLCPSCWGGATGIAAGWDVFPPGIPVVVAQPEMNSAISPHESAGIGRNSSRKTFIA
jgi:hypothetical protein